MFYSSWFTIFVLMKVSIESWFHAFIWMPIFGQVIPLVPSFVYFRLCKN